MGTVLALPRDLKVDELFDEADCGLIERQNREAFVRDRKSNPITIDPDQLQNPFIVMVHESEISLTDIPSTLRITILGQIEKLKKDYDYTTAGPHSVAVGVPMDRPIVVCGAYREVCVLQQHDRLLEAGFQDVFVSSKGVLSFFD